MRPLCCIVTAPAQNAPQAENELTIRATVNEVALDLVVRDKKGRLVRSLKPGDVEIYEDGVRQEIRTLRLVGGDEAPAQPGQPAEPRVASAGASQPGSGPWRPPRNSSRHAFTTNRDELLHAAARAFNGSSVDITGPRRLC